MADRPAIFPSSALNLGIRQSEIRLIAITVISFIGGTILIFALGWAVMQVVDRVREHRTADTRRTGQFKSFAYKCKKAKKWNHFFNERRWRNGDRDGLEDPLVDIEAKRTRAALYPLRGGDRLQYLYPSGRLAELHSARSRFGGTDSEYSLPRMPLPTYSPAASFSSSHSSPQFSPPSYRTDPSCDRVPEESPNPTQSHERYQYFSNGVALDIAAPISSRPFSYTTRIPAPQVDDEPDQDSFSLFSPPPLRIPSPPPPIYASPSSSASPWDSPSSTYSSPPSCSTPFSSNHGDLGLDIDYYMMFCDTDRTDAPPQSPEAANQEPRRNARRFGWANLSACLPSNLSLSSVVRRKDAGKSMSGSLPGSPVLPGRPTGPLPPVPTTSSLFKPFISDASSPSSLRPVSGLGLRSDDISDLRLNSGSINASPAESLGCRADNKILIHEAMSQPRSILLTARSTSTRSERPTVSFVSSALPSAPFPGDKDDQARHSLPSSASGYSTSAYLNESRVEEGEECDLSAIWEEMMRNVAPLCPRKRDESSSTDETKTVSGLAI
ncbi:hypothetical protein BDN71DRAFT_1451564 [Pleurotus eryngii]|uniref:Uncharacterized protein n=1 Tax=Pleurotus eryngii TaxID=5323 RepID=A0A9P5ZTF8_PLEER|nr:hypothetical protein BDN71DRAFT_1451564 [Pleurotus eryngii]